VKTSEPLQAGSAVVSDDERLTLNRLMRVHGPGGLKAALLACLLTPDNSRSVLAWREETSTTPDAETVLVDTTGLSAAGAAGELKQDIEFARQGVRVNALCPGPVNTPLLQELFAADPERAARRLVHVPLGRFAEPVEMANAVLFLASDESSFITANTFLVDGGISGAYVTPL